MMKATRVFPWSKSIDRMMSEEDHRKRWQAFYDSAGLLGIELTGDWRDRVEDARRKLGKHGEEVTLTIHAPTLDQVTFGPRFPAYDPKADHGGRGLR